MNNNDNDKKEEIDTPDVSASEEKQSQEETVSTEELESLKELARKLESKYKLALADYVNLQRRTDEQRIRWIEEANKNLLLKIFPILDTLQLAQKHNQDQGLLLSIDQFIKVLESEGVTKIKTVGQQFDANTMECVTTTEGIEGKVLEEIRAGFMLHDLVLRSAQVIVGKTSIK